MIYNSLIINFKTVRSSIEAYLKNAQANILWKRFKQKKMPKIYQHLSFDVLTGEIIDLLKKIEENVDISVQAMMDGELKK